MEAAISYRAVPLTNLAERRDLGQAQPRASIAVSETVQAADSAQLSADLPDRMPQRDRIREIEIDPETEAVVFRTIDPASGRVVNQAPAEALLRLRAYLRATPARIAEQAAGRQA